MSSIFERPFYTNPETGKNNYLKRRHEKKGPKGYKRSNESIYEEACEILYRDPEVDATEIELTVSGGIIYLQGSVDSRHAKRSAEAALENISGIDDIQNQLTIKPCLDIDTDKTIARGDNGLFTQEYVPR